MDDSSFKALNIVINENSNNFINEWRNKSILWKNISKMLLNPNSMLSKIGSIFFENSTKIVLKIIPNTTGTVTIAKILSDVGIKSVLNIIVLSSANKTKKYNFTIMVL